MSAQASSIGDLIHAVHNFGINPETRELFLHSYMSDAEEEPGVDWRMATKLQKLLSLLTSGSRATDPILIHMHTIGGNWEDGLAIYDTIKSCTETHITILSYAHARSMSSIIFQAGDTRIFMPNTIWLMHMGTQSFDGDAQSFEAEADEAKLDHDRMLDIYVNSAYESIAYKGKSRKQVKVLIDKGLRFKQEWYMSPKEAIRHGYGDAVFGDVGYEDMNAIFPRQNNDK